MNHSIKDYINATRYWSFSVSAMPVIVAFSYLCSSDGFSFSAGTIIKLILCILGVVILHAAGNLLSDYFDFKSGVDNKDAFAVPNLVFGKFQPKEYLVFSIVLFAVGIIIGLILTIMSGLGLLIIGAAGVLLTALYSPLKYHALGDLDIFIIFAPLIMTGTGFALSGNFIPSLAILSVPIGIITVSVLHANNTVDIYSDTGSGIRTFASLIGVKASCLLYKAYMVLPFVCVIAYVAAGLVHPFALLCIAAILPAYRNFKQAGDYKSKGNKALSGLDIASSKLQLVFSGLLSIGLLISAAIQL